MTNSPVRPVFLRSSRLWTERKPTPKYRKLYVAGAVALFVAVIALSFLLWL